MKKAVLIIAGLAVAGAGGWSALWYSGRSQVSERLDHEIARLAGEGIKVSHGTRRIEGFPLAYRVTYEDVTIRQPDAGVTYRLPALTGEASVGKPDELTISFPSHFDVLINPQPSIATGDENQPTEQEQLNIEVESEDLAVTMIGLPGTGQTVRTTARSVLFVHAAKDQASNIALELAGLSSEARLPVGQTGGEIRSFANIDRLDLLAIIAEPDQPKTTINSVIENLHITGTTDLRTTDAVIKVLRGSEGGRIQVTYQTGPAQSVVTVEGGAPETDGTLKANSLTSSAAVEIVDNAITVSSLSEQSRFQIEPATEVTALSGMLDIARLDVVYTAPIAPSEEMSPLAIRLGAIGVAPDETLWGHIDPGSKLVRDPLKLVANVEGTARLTKDPTDLRTGEAPPISFGNVSVKEVQITGLGAEVTTRGDLEFIPSLMTPKGTLTVELRSVLPAIRSLRDAGLLDAATLEYLELLAQAFTRPGDKPGLLISEIELDPQGILVNGMPIQ